MCLFKNMGQQDLTHLCALKESIPYYFPSCVSFTILTYKRTKHWEQHLKLCLTILKLVGPQRQMTCLKKIDGTLKEKMEP